MPSVTDADYLRRHVGDSVLMHQEDAYNAILESRRLGESKCLVKMFCGTGKSRVIFKDICDPNFGLSIVVFPTLSLGTQFLRDYVSCETFYIVLNICSDVEGTTEEREIKSFLSTNEKKKIILVTYASLSTLVSTLSSTNTTADVVAYDESHNATGEKIQEYVFESTFAKYQTFFTATPKNNNGVIMKSENEGETGNCGRCVYEYSFMNAIEDGVCQDFEIMLYFRSTTHVFDGENDDDDDLDDNNPEKQLTMIANCVQQTRLKRVIIFHRFSEAENEGGTTAKKFATKTNETTLKKALKKLGDHRQISLKGVTGKTKKEERESIVSWFSDSDSEDVRVISNCKVFGEGIDTASADVAVFIDPKGSLVDIIQNVGRICRKKSTEKKSVILIPVFINKDQYDEAPTKEAKDLVFRDCINARDNWNTILNVLSALRQEDPEYYDLCLRYPSNFSPEEVKEKLSANGMKTSDTGKTLGQILKENRIELGEDENEDTSLERLAKVSGKTVQVVSQNMGKDFLKTYGDGQRDVVKYFKQDDGKFYKIEGDGVLSEEGESVKPKRKPFGNRIRVSGDSELKVLWSAKEFVQDFEEGILTRVESELEERADVWLKNLECVKAFIKDKGRRPSYHLKDKEEEKKGRWLSNQLTNAKTRKYIMKEEDIFRAWTAFVESDEFKAYFDLDHKREWLENLEWVKAFIKDKGRRPSYHSKDEEEKKKGQWFSKQITNAKTRRYIMKEDDIFGAWTAFVNSYELKAYFDLDHKREWLENLEWVKAFIKDKGRRPSYHSKDKEEKKKGVWLAKQLKNTKPRQQIMKEDEIFGAWTAFVSHPDFAKFFPSCQQKDFHPEQCSSCSQHVSSLDDGLCEECVINKSLKPISKSHFDKAQHHPSTVLFDIIDDSDSEIEDDDVNKSTKPTLPTAPKPLDHFIQKASALSKEELEAKVAKQQFQAQSNCYPADKKKEDVNKITANTIFASVSKPQSPESLALVLDSSNFLTTKALVERGFNADNIYIPQFYKPEYNIQKEVHRNVVNKSLYEFLNESEDCHFAATWFDYHGTITGNDTCRPLEDIKLYFSRGFPEIDSTFAVTFCKRNVQFSEGVDVVEKSKELIHDIAEKYGYYLIREKMFEYGNGMYYVHWKVVKM